MNRVVLASGNRGKIKEIKEILAGRDIEIVPMGELGVSEDIVENGETYAENALIKARTLCRLTGLPAIADDSGLEVDYLDKEPGVYSARYMGTDTSYAIKNKAIIDRLAGVPDELRTARFAAAAVIVYPDGRETICTGTMEGRIAYEPSGGNGFGYDPILFLPEYGCTSASLTDVQKNAVSHRGKAFRALGEEIMEQKGGGR
jgi:XTP/dITP diphosphohydrolase